jgi:topoisomerase-4 subunit A
VAVERTPAGTWKARWRENGRARSRNFHRKIDAQRFLRDLGTDRDRGLTAPTRSTITVASMADEWLTGALNLRRSSFADAPAVDADAALEAMIVREPITIILSERGWIRAAKGRVEDPSELKFKEGDKLQFLVPAETTDKLLIFASDGRFFTLACDKLPGARGHGEPLRLMIDLDDKVGLVDVFVHRPGARRVIASKDGYGFILPEVEAVAFRRAGKQVLNGTALTCVAVGDADHLAVVGDNGKLLIFPITELPEMPRGKGVKLQSYREGGLRDAMVFGEGEGASWTTSDGRTRVWPEWREWLGRRASAGKLVPKGFPATKRFRPR